MLDGFESIKVALLQPDWEVLVLDRPLECVSCEPAARGGDFYDLELVDRRDGDSNAFLEVDANTRVLAKAPE